MGKVLKYVGWAFLGIVVLVLGTVGILFATGAFNDETIYLDTITFDSDTLKTGIDPNDTTLSVINDTLIATDNFSINTTFEPASATAKTLNIKVLKGSDVISVPNTIVAGQPLEIELKKERRVYTDTYNYKLIDNVLYYENDTPVSENVTYELFPDVKVIKINEEYHKYVEYNVGGEVKIQATDSEGGTTYTNFDFYVDSAITKLNYDFSSVDGGLANNTIVFNESDMTFTLDTTPTHAINPSTGEVYDDIFSMKNIITTSSDEDIIKIKKSENLVAYGNGSQETYRYIKYTFNSLKAGTSTITSKALPTYQMMIDYLATDDVFKNGTVAEAYSAITAFANKYKDYLILAGDIIEQVDGENVTITTEGYEWYKSMLNSSGNFIINYETDYIKLMNFLFITVSQDIVVENIEIKSFRITRTAADLELFDTLTNDGKLLNRQNMIEYFGMNLESTSTNISPSAVNVRLDDLKMYSVKEYQAFDSVDAIEGEGLFTITKMVEGQLTEVPYYFPFESSDGTTKYMTFVPNNSVLSVINPSAENNYTWTIRANKEQERDDDGTAVIMILYDEVSDRYFDAKTKINIKVKKIDVFSLNTGLIRDMSLSTVNDHGKPNRIMVDLRYENIGTANSLIREFTEGASYKNIKLFVTANTAKLDGVLKVKVKTKDGTEDGEPMVYMMPIGTSDVEVFEIDYTTSDGLICIEALNTSIKYTLDADNNPSSAPTLNTIMMYVGVVRTDVQGRPVDAEGNLVNDKVLKEGSDDVYEYKYQYDFISVANESLSFNIYSYLQSVQFYTADEGAASNFRNRTTVDGVAPEPIKMIVGQRFDLYVTNLPLDENGGFVGKTTELNILNTAFFDFYFNNLTGTNKSAEFETNNPAAEVQATIDMVKGMIKITIECKDATTSADVYIAVNEQGNNFLETCTANLQLSYASIAKVPGTNNNDVRAYYSEGASTNQIIENNESRTIKGVLQGTDLTWQVFDEVGNTNIGQFAFGGVEEQKSLDYNIDLNIDEAYVYRTEEIIEDIKTSATYKWTSSHPDYVEISEKADANGYDPNINICKGEEEGITVTITCQVFMYPEAEGSSEAKYNNTKFIFRFVLKVIQSDIIVDGYSIYELDHENYWQINDSTTTSQKIVGGSNFDILKRTSAKDTVGGNSIERNPITATIDGIDIRSSLTFTIETYSSADNPNSHHPIYFLDENGEITYSVSGLTMDGDDFSLVVYAKDTLTTINAGIKISTYYTGYANFVYHITVLPNLEEQVSLPAGKSYIETTVGVGGEIYTFGEKNKTLDDYYAINKVGGGVIPLKYTILSNNAYGSISGSEFEPKRVAPQSASHYQEVRVLVEYTITLPDSSPEVYTYDTISVHVLPYYNVVEYSSEEFDVKSGASTNLFTAKEYEKATDLDETLPNNFSGSKLFILSSGFDTELDDLNDILAIKLVEDSEGQLRNILGDAGYQELLENDMYLTDGVILTSPSLTTDEMVKYQVYFKEDDRNVLIGGGQDNPLYLFINNTVRYETIYDESNPYEKEKLYDVTYSEASGFDVNYRETTFVVFDNDPLVVAGGSNLVALNGGNGETVFSKIVTEVTLQQYNGGSYTLLYNYNVIDEFVRRNGTNAILGIEASENQISKVTITYNDSVNEATTYRLAFKLSNGLTYYFFFKLLPNITVMPFYPVEIDRGFENVEYGTTIDLETNYIRKYNRVELAYNDKVLGARLQSTVDDDMILTVPTDTLIASGLVDRIDTATLGGMTINDLKIALSTIPTVAVKVNGSNKLFSYRLVSGSEYIDSGSVTSSRMTFVIPNGGVAGNAEVEVKAFNGAIYNYVFKVQNKITKHSVSVATPIEAQVSADNEFNLKPTFINSCRLGTSSDYDALRIIVVDFNGTTLKVNDGGFQEVKPYDLIPYDGVFKFNDVATSKVVIFRMYTTTSVEGDAVVELHLTVNPNAIVITQIQSVPAGEEIQFENTERSPFVITYGDVDRTPIPSAKLTYTLVDENGNPHTYDDDVVKSGNKITYPNISTEVSVYVKIEVNLNGVIYEVIKNIKFIPDIKITFDYESSAVSSTYKNMTAAVIGPDGNTTALDMWDHETNSSSMPIMINDYYGNSLANNSTSLNRPNYIRFELTESGGIIDNIHPTQGRILYYPSNKTNVSAKITVVITWDNGAVFRKTYNIHFQPNIAEKNGVSIEYSNKTGNAIDATKSYVSLYGASRVEILTFNTNNTTAIDARVNPNTVFMQAYKRDGVEVINSCAINVLDTMGEKIISYIRFNSDDNNPLYKIVEESGHYYIDFEAVKQQTQVTIPYYLDLVDKSTDANRGGGLFTSEINENYYKSLTKGEIVINLFPVIANVATVYNVDNPRSLIIRQGDTNVINMYNLLDVTLIESASFTNGTDSVLINKDRLAKLFSLSVDNSYAYKDGQNIVFNLNDVLVNKITLTFTIEGIAEEVQVVVSYGSKASLNTIDAVKTFTFNGENFYIIENEIYDYKLTLRGNVNGEQITIDSSHETTHEGHTVEISSVVTITDFTIDGGSKVLNIYSAETGTADGKIDLSTMVKYEVQNRKVVIGGTTYYLDEIGVAEYQLVEYDLTKYTGEFKVNDNSITIEETQTITKNSDKGTVVFNGTTYYVNKLNSEYFLFSNDSTDEDKKVTSITAAEFVATPKIDFGAAVVYFDKDYPLVDEFVQLSKNGLTYMPGTVGENDRYTQSGNILDLIPFYSTDLATDKKPFTFDVNSNNDLSTNISFYILPIETTWSIKFNGITFTSGYVTITTPASGAIGTVNIEANYKTLAGTKEASGYKYVVDGSASIVSIEENTNVLKVNYQNFSEDVIVRINVQAYFNGELVTNGWDIKIAPMRAFTVIEQVDTLDPRSAHEYLIENGDDGFVTRGTYGAYDELVFELTDDADAEFATISADKTKVEVASRLYLLANKEIKFNVTFTTKINEVTCVFNRTVSLILNQNTKMLGLQKTYTADSSNTVVHSGETMKTTMNTGSAFKLVDITDETNEYTELSVSLSNFSPVTDNNYDITTGSITAEIESGLINIYFTKDGSNNYPSTIDATFVINVTYGTGPSAKVVYTSDTIRARINSPV